MNTVTFIYKKKDKLWFLNLEDALEQETKLKKQGWKHIASIDPAIMLSNIYDICQEEYCSDKKIAGITSMLMSC
jgi:hypothetical protein